MTKTDGSFIGGQFVLNLEYSDFGIVSGFGFRYSDFMAIPAPVELPKSRIEHMRQRTVASVSWPCALSHAPKPYFPLNPTYGATDGELCRPLLHP
jgi:hypothetical protein